jgi:hypothetical protein
MAVPNDPRSGCSRGAGDRQSLAEGDQRTSCPEPGSVSQTAQWQYVKDTSGNPPTETSGNDPPCGKLWSPLENLR